MPSIIGYGHPDALDRCERRDRWPEALPDWSELARRLVQNGETDPPELRLTSPATAT